LRIFFAVQVIYFANWWNLWDEDVIESHTVSTRKKKLHLHLMHNREFISACSFSSYTDIITLCLCWKISVMFDFK